MCDSCGQVPAYWQLNDSVLSPVLFDQVDGQKTINMPLSQGKVNFIGGSDSSLTESAIYCAKVSRLKVNRRYNLTWTQRDSSTSNGLPGLLSVNGSPDQFSVCSFVGTPGPAHRRDVYYNQIPNRVTYSCQPVHLVMQSTGFVPEPISDWLAKPYLKVWFLRASSQPLRKSPIGNCIISSHIVHEMKDNRAWNLYD